MAELRPFSCFVTGTDTGVGKTAIAAALVRAQAGAGVRVAAMKPVAAGAICDRGRWCNEDVEQLRAVASVAADAGSICPYLFEAPVAPHLAARQAGVSIDPQVLLRAFERLRAAAEAVVVEGVGGFRVPLAPGFDTADLASRLRLPVVLVVGLRLGCLNHAALTAEAIAARGLRLAGWVANGIDPEMRLPAENFAALQELLAAPCLGRVPHLATAEAASVQAHLELARLQS